MDANTNKINLFDITLCSIDCVQPEVALESLLESSIHINFGKTILFGDRTPNNLPPWVNFVKIPKINNLIEYSNFVLVDLTKYINTNFCIIVHADGFIHNPHLWNKEFKKWDYIGAPWPTHLWFVDEHTRVGNGGVSLRSKKLMDFVAKFGYVNQHEDDFICTKLKNILKENNIHIAPLDIAKTFSCELFCNDLNINPEVDCFAFHGKSEYSNFHKKQNDYIQEKTKKRTMSKIDQKYSQRKNTPSDINEHLPTLYEYAKSCKTIAEFGVRHVVSSYAFAAARPEKLICLDIDKTSNVDVFLQECAEENINVEFVNLSSLDYELTQEVDLLFIDTLHTYEQLSNELEKHHNKVIKYIVFHDTTGPWAFCNEDPITGKDTGEKGEKVGLVPALKEFLKKHNEWKEVCTYTNNNGLTIIQRQ